MILPPFDWCAGNRTIKLGQRTLIMGIVNVTPDSFFDGGQYDAVDQAVLHAHKLIEKGADIIDIGGESTRPGSDGISAAEEIDRVIPVIQSLKKTSKTPVSIDTVKAKVAKEAIEAGAKIVNDISGFSCDPEMINLIAEKKCGAVLMHMRGTPKNMQELTDYENFLPDLIAEIEASVKKALAGGIKKECLVIDPGIGFAKKPEHNLLIINNIKKITEIGYPLLIGHSRKSFIGIALERAGLNGEPDKRYEASVGVTAISAYLGAHIIRVHDVAGAKQAVCIADAVRDGVFAAN